MHHFTKFTALTMVLGLSVLSGCTTSYYSNAAFKYLDDNADGIVTRAEYISELSTDSSFAKEARAAGMTPTEKANRDYDTADRDGNEALTSDEFLAYVKSQ